MAPSHDGTTTDEPTAKPLEAADDDATPTPDGAIITLERLFNRDCHTVTRRSNDEILVKIVDSCFLTQQRSAMSRAGLKVDAIHPHVVHQGTDDGSETVAALHLVVKDSYAGDDR